MPLDRTDIALLAALRKNARTPNNVLADKAGVAPSTALERVRRLRADGVILGYHAEIQPAALGLALQAMIDVRLARHALDAVSAFEQHLGTLREVLAWYHLAGATDYLIHAALRDSAHLRTFVLDAIAARAEIAHIETHLIFSFRRNDALPLDEAKAAPST